MTHSLHKVHAKTDKRGEGKRRREEGLGCRVEGVKLNLGSYHPFNRLCVIWNCGSECGSKCDSECDSETAQVGCASLIFN